MGRLMTVLAVTLVAALTGCTGSNPIQRELGYTSQLQLTNKSSLNLSFELVAGTTPGEIGKGDIVSSFELAPGETLQVPTYPGRYTLFPRNADAVGARSLAYNGVDIKANTTEKLIVSEQQVRTINGVATHLTMSGS